MKYNNKQKYEVGENVHVYDDKVDFISNIKTFEYRGIGTILGSYYQICPPDKNDYINEDAFNEYKIQFENGEIESWFRLDNLKNISYDM